MTLNSWLIVKLKGCSTAVEIVTEFVIEIGTEHTWLFQCTLFYYGDRSAIFMIEIVTDLSDTAMLILN